MNMLSNAGPAEPDRTHWIKSYLPPAGCRTVRICTRQIPSCMPLGQWPGPSARRRRLIYGAAAAAGRAGSAEPRLSGPGHMGAPNPYQRLYDRVKVAVARRKVDRGCPSARIYRWYTLRRRPLLNADWPTRQSPEPVSNSLFAVVSGKKISTAVRCCFEPRTISLCRYARVEKQMRKVLSSVVIARQHAYACRARYCYGKSVRLSVCLSVWHTLVLCRNECTMSYCQSHSTV